MKVILAIVLVLIALTLIPVEPARADHHGRYTVTATNGVRMRARPTTASRIIRLCRVALESRCGHSGRG
jgi:hypothetical protein